MPRRPRIRKATPEDAGAIAHVRATTWRNAYAHIYTRDQLESISVDESTERWRRQLEAAPDRFHTLVAELDDAVVGFASLGPRDFSGDEVQVGELYAIYVLPDAQGCGAGRALLRRAVGLLRR